MTTLIRTMLAVVVLAATGCGTTDDPPSTRAVPTESAITAPVTDRSGSTSSMTGVRPADAASAGNEESGPATDLEAVYAPPPGVYAYDVTGTIETSGITGSSRQPAPATSTDHIRVSQGEAAMRMIVLTRDEGEESTQEIVVAVTDEEARLVRLSRRPDTGVGISINPDPPALIAQLPYLLTGRWEIAWNDPGTGVSGVGTGTVEREETISTSAGDFDTVVVTVVQELRGTVTGTLTVTTWIDPATGVQPKQHTVTDLQDATGASRTDTTRTLRSLPA